MKKTPVYRLIAEKLIRDIENGVLRPGQLIPSSRELMDNYGVARNTTRDAIRVLEHKGLVRTVTGSGSYVVPVSSDVVWVALPAPDDVVDAMLRGVQIRYPHATAEASAHPHKDGEWVRIALNSQESGVAIKRRPRRPCRCGHGVSKHRFRVADASPDGRQGDRNTSCTECECGEFVGEEP